MFPEFLLDQHGKRFESLISSAQKLPPIKTAVVHPCDALSMSGAFEARQLGLIVPTLVGPRSKIKAAAMKAKLSLDGIAILDALHSHAAAALAVQLANEGKVCALMKGALHTDELMEAVVAPESHLLTERRMSHVFVFDIPHYPKLLFITDAAINICPSLDEKRDILQNAIDLALALGIEEPKVAILSAVETVYPRIRSTVEAAALCKMADRGQIIGGFFDGPLAFDNAISVEAAEAKHIVSKVAGNADILVAPDLESGNMMAKQLIYFSGADAAGVVLGARVPIILTSRADGSLARVVSCGAAQLFARLRVRSKL
jgi:phosphate acetyltransferase